VYRWDVLSELAEQKAISVGVAAPGNAATP
jgi:hypothetical protein